MKKYLPLWLFLCGALAALPLCYPKLGFLQWLLMVPGLYLILQIVTDPTCRLRGLFPLGFSFFFGLYLMVWHSFLYLYPMDFMNLTPVEAAGTVAFCWVGLSFLQAVLSMGIFPLFGLLLRMPLLRRYPILSPALFAAQWVINEWSQTLTWVGVPWARVAIGQTAYPIFAGGAALFGSYFISFSVVAVAGYIAFALIHAPARRLSAALALVIFLLNFTAGMIGYMAADPTDGRPLTVAAVQGNVGSELKWTEDSDVQSRVIYEKYVKEAAEAGAAFVVFPETFIPQSVRYDSPLGRYVIGLATKYNITIFCGAFEISGELDRNAVFMITPDGEISETFYTKRHLVPFGEHVPWRPFIETCFPILTNLGVLPEDLEQGTDSALFHTVWGDIGTLLCFDSIYETLTLDSVRDGAELMILPTNDSWFTDSPCIHMHYAQAKLRAIESGRWILRAGDTGISGLIAPNGTSTTELPPMTEGLSMGTVYFKTSTTLYTRIGNLLVYLAMAAVAALPIHALTRYLLKKKKPA